MRGPGLALIPKIREALEQKRSQSATPTAPTNSSPVVGSVTLANQLNEQLRPLLPRRGGKSGAPLVGSRVLGQFAGGRG